MRRPTARATSRASGGAAAFVVLGLCGACSSSSDDASSATPAVSARAVPSATAPAVVAATATTPETDPITPAAAADPPTTQAPTTDSTAPPLIDDQSASTAQSPDVPYPTSEWPVGRLPEGVDAAALDAAVASAFGADDADARVRSLVVVKGGEIVYERYHPLDSADRATPSWSVAKSLTSAVLGMLIGEGRLELDAPAPVEEWQAEGDPRREITLEDLLRMSSGLAWEESFATGSVLQEMLQAPDAATVPISQQLVAEPGTQFQYSTGTTAILAEVAADELGGGDDLDVYVHERLLDPLGMTSTVLSEDSTGTWLGGLGADSTPRDFAKFGLLFLRDGVWDGERILPEGWVEASRSPSPTNPTYGLQWWINRPQGTFAALGLGGQQIIVSPELDVVIVTTSTEGGDPYTLANTVHELLASTV